MRKSHIGFLILIAVCVALLLGNTQDFSTYTDFETAGQHQGTMYQIVGNLDKETPLHYEPTVDPNYFSFFMTDKEENRRKVVYLGAPPQDFERSEDVVLHGQMKGNEFHASKILLKCPSKYEDGTMEIKEYEAGA
ncbi:cytochrome c maturation protein CcmE [Chitinophagales bacterium]|nr:cytochrome c maturation protein CcmE [Chitinophagales bacterium]